MNWMTIVCHSLNNNTRTGLIISLCLNVNTMYFNQSDPPRMAAKFRHLLSCGTIGADVD